jgi:hypothetical protein
MDLRARIARMTMIEVEPSGVPTWVQVHVNGHLGWPAGVGYRVVALTPRDAVR